MNLPDVQDIQTLGLTDPDYPEILRSISDPPPVLSVRGKLLKEDSLAVAIVGTRSASAYGLTMARQLSHDLARSGLTIVSGLAEGIDGAAHEGALEVGGRTVAVLGHGLSMVYPPHHEGLASRIVCSGALVSEFPWTMEPRRENFPRRNRVIAGLSLGVIVIEAPFKSGALITAREALEQGREVFAVPGQVSSIRSQGCHQLLKDGARLVEDYRDVLEEIAPHLKRQLDQFRNQTVDPSASLPSGLSAEEAVVFQAIPEAGPSLVEALVQQTAFPPSKLLGLLTRLELNGLVRQIPGQGYVRS
jgi:DNA processing protein